jgi:Peptidase family M48
MRSRKILPAILVLSAIPGVTTAQEPTIQQLPARNAQGPTIQQLPAPTVQQPAGTTAQQQMTKSEVLDKIISQEQAEVQLLRQYSPLVETYIQNVRRDKQLGAQPDGDKYFIGRAALGRGVELEPLAHESGMKHKVFGSWTSFFSTEFVPRGFLQMIYLDMNGFDRQHYKIEYVRREFLGEVRCLVFDVDPLPKAGKGRFVGRIWVEDQDFHIVRFNGAYGGSSLTSSYFNFDSWRTNSGKNLWLPSFIYSEQGSVRDAKTRRLGLKAFRAQTRLWGYDLGNVREEQELSKVLVEAPNPVNDQSEAANDYSPFQAERSWGRQAEDNVTERLEREGLIAPRGEVDKALDTVVNNLEVTNNLDLQPEVRCRVLMTSTLESFTMGHTIVLSRGLIDVLPDEASLAVILAHELGHVVLGHRMDTQFAFFNRVRFDEKETFRHFDFARTPEEEEAAKQKGNELLNNSPYKEQSGSAQLFLQALKSRSKEIPNLISPHLGDRVSTGWTIVAAVFFAQPSDAEAKPAANAIAALPLGGRIKIDPWNDQLRMLKSKAVGTLAESEKVPFEVTPFVLYLTRQGDHSTTETPSAVAAKTDPETKP